MDVPQIHPELTRRSFLKKGLLGGAVLAVGGVGLAVFPSESLEPQAPLRFFTRREYATFSAIAARIVAPREGWPTPRELKVAEKADEVLLRAHPGAQKELKQLLGLFESALAGLLFDQTLLPFSRRNAPSQDEALEAWKDSRLAVRRTGYKALHNLAAAIYYASPEIFPKVGYPGPPRIGPLAEEGAR